MDSSLSYDVDHNNSTIQNSSNMMKHEIRARQSSNIIFAQCIVGRDELFSQEATITEFIATAYLIFTLTTTIIACLESQYTEPKLLVPIAIFIDAFLLLMATVPISGGHMNPIFTFIAALKEVITLLRALFYTIAQCVGSLLAYAIVKRVINQHTVQKYTLGGCIIHGNGGGISAGNALIIECVCACLVLYVAITTAFDKRKSKELGLVMVCVIVAGVYALAVYASITVAGVAGYGGVGLHPARCLWDGHWVFWLGPFLACLFYYVFSLTLPRDVGM